MVRFLYILTGHLKNDVRTRKVDKDAGSNDRGRTHLSIKVELTLCLQLAQPMAIEKSLRIALYHCRRGHQVVGMLVICYLSGTFCVCKSICCCRSILTLCVLSRYLIYYIRLCQGLIYRNYCLVDPKGGVIV